MDGGCRKGEAMELNWDRIVWQGDRAVVRLFATDTKANRSRQVPLTMRASAVLRRLRDQYPDAMHIFQHEENGETRRIGNPRKAVETALTRGAVKPCGGDDFHIHDRHHFASRLAQKGCHPGGNQGSARTRRHQNDAPLQSSVSGQSRSSCGPARLVQLSASTRRYVRRLRPAARPFVQ
jgi:integrase